MNREPPYPFRTVVQSPDRVANVYSVAEREGERAAFCYRGCDGGFEEIHGRGMLAARWLRCCFGRPGGFRGSMAEGYDSRIRVLNCKEWLLNAAKVFKCEDSVTGGLWVMWSSWKVGCGPRLIGLSWPWINFAGSTLVCFSKLSQAHTTMHGIMMSTFSLVTNSSPID